jgi:hypothetical protein
MHDKDSLWNRIPYELKLKGEIECYDKVNELHPEYPGIIYNHALRYKQRLKNIAATIKVKSLRDINNNKMIFIIL